MEEDYINYTPAPLGCDRKVDIADVLAKIKLPVVY